MRIAYDATTLYLTKGGTTVYLRNLIDNLETIKPDNDYDLYFTNIGTHKNFLIKKAETLYREFFWRENILPKKALKKKSDIIHFPNHYAALNSKIPSVVTFHDIYVLKNPDAFPLSQVKYSQFILPKVIKSASKIIAISNFTKMEMLNHFDIDEGKIKVVNQGVNAAFKPINDEKSLNEVELKYNLPKNFILYVGAIEPRKNVDKLIEAFDIVRDSIDISLVIVSFGGWKNKNIFRLINSSRYKKHIHLLGYVTDDDLPKIYNLAITFVYPSIYEGFGLPLLEAMSCGCPVIGTNNTVANEVVGDAGILLDSTDINLLANSILFMTEKLTFERYKSSGIERAKYFSWDKCANETFELYQSIING